MHWSDFTTGRVSFEIRKCRSLQRLKCMDYWQENPILYENKRFIKAVLQWRFSCMGLKRLLHQNKGNFRCSWIEPNKQQPYGQMLIGRGQLNDWNAKSIRQYLPNASCAINYSNTMCDNYWRKLGLRPLVPEAYLPKILLKWRLLQKKRLMGR